METLANAASAVSHAIFGDTTTQPSEEPVSGELGDTTKGEPYDAGNASCKSKFSLIRFKDFGWFETYFIEF